MKQTNKCPKCSSSNVLADARVIDRTYMGTYEFTVSTFRNPEALVLKGETSSTVSAWVCAECGYLELYADRPDKLRRPA